MDNFKKILITLALSISATSFAGNVGAGIVLGQPTGLSLRVDNSTTSAFDAALAWRLGNAKYLFMHADYLWIRPGALKLDSAKADFYYGVGAIIALPESDVAAALRIPVGLSHKFKNPDLELFGELAVAFTIVPATDFDIVGGVGLRYWF